MRRLMQTIIALPSIGGFLKLRVDLPQLGGVQAELGKAALPAISNQ